MTYYPSSQEECKQEISRLYERIDLNLKTAEAQVEAAFKAGFHWEHKGPPTPYGEQIAQNAFKAWRDSIEADMRNRLLSEGREP